VSSGLCFITHRLPLPPRQVSLRLSPPASRFPPRLCTQPNRQRNPRIVERPLEDRRNARSHSGERYVHLLNIVFPLPNFSPIPARRQSKRPVHCEFQDQVQQRRHRSAVPRAWYRIANHNAGLTRRQGGEDLARTTQSSTTRAPAPFRPRLPGSRHCSPFFSATRNRYFQFHPSNCYPIFKSTRLQPPFFILFLIPCHASP
jgi:hypothetical protein